MSMRLHLHQPHHPIGDFQGIGEYLRGALRKAPTGLHLFPEMYLTGYPCRDLWVEATFVQGHLDSLEKLQAWAHKLPPRSGPGALLGGPDYHFEGGRLAKIENAVYHLIPGEGLKKVYAKKRLPNYDIFDEKRYFTPGEISPIWKFQDKVFGLLVCEDIWPPHPHLAEGEADPLQEVRRWRESGGALDLVINLSASPWGLDKPRRRMEALSSASKILKAPIAFVNCVGGEDEILFDGASKVIDGEEIVARASSFGADRLEFSLPAIAKAPDSVNKEWREEAVEAVAFGIGEYARKCHIKEWIVGLSGGIDSALALTLARLGGANIEAVFLPGLYSSQESSRLAEEICRRQNIRLRRHPIKFLHSAIRKEFGDNFGDIPKDTADENIQARLRGLLLYALSNGRPASAVLNTSNKSEIAVGYSTLHGDSVGALSPLGDLYKSEIYDMAEYLNQKFDSPIPSEIISRPPSAELKPDQRDQDTLPPYSRLDAILRGLLEEGLTPHELSRQQFDPEEVQRVYRLYRRAEYKRRQFCPILKLRAESFGQGHRMPLTCQEL